MITVKKPLTSQVSSGQKEQVIRVVVDAVRKGMEQVVGELVSTGAINSTNLQRVLAQGGTLGTSVVPVVKSKMVELAENLIGRLKLISGGEKIVIGKTDGKGTIARAESLFTGWLDRDFVNYGTDVPSKPTEEEPVQVFEMVKDGTFAQIFGGFGENLDRLCLTQDQIIRFVKYHTKWLRTDGYGTFFLFKVGNEFFVADVYRGVGRLSVHAFRLSSGLVWHAGFHHRVVVPQL